MSETKIRPGESLPAVQNTGNFSLSFGDIGPGLEGDWGAESSRIPFLSIGQKMSEFTETHPEALGGIIYAKKVIVPKPVIVSIFGARQYYRQNLSFDRIASALSFATKEQVLAAGGNLNRSRPGLDDNNYQPELTCKLVLFSEAKGKKAWADHDEVLSHPVHNGTLAVPVFWTLRGVAYGENVPGLRMIERALREDGKQLAHARFELMVTKKTYTNTTFVPFLQRLAEDNPQDVVDILPKLFGS